ncbi:MAG: carboxypeptidase M32 [Candidatus Binatia bacterium]
MAHVDRMYGRLVAALRAQTDLSDTLQLLEWDQETVMPAGAVERRARQIGTLAAVLHERRTDPAFLALVDELAAAGDELETQQAADVRETKWRLDRARCLDPELVRERSTLHAQARAVWVSARRDNDFSALAPWLRRVFDTERRMAAAIDPRRPAYDVLLEEFEPGMSAETLDRLFRELHAGLQPLVERLQRTAERRHRRAGALCGVFPVDAQRGFNRLVAGRLGFVFDKGRLDEAAHPFTATVGDDVRIATRYAADDLRYGLYATIHETGHALYEQGLDPVAWGTPSGSACSFGIHESQSRLWENQVGRSEAFWKHLLPAAREAFPALAGRSLDAVLFAVNDAGPSLIRTEADEITYNLHIILRFELERSLIDGTLEVAALPRVWRERMRRYLGIEPESDRDGVLQDVHWSGGAIGYFPSYALGNVYAAQLFKAAQAEIGPLDDAVTAGEFAVLLGWLRQRVHRFGQTYRPVELIARATGGAPTVRPLLEHLASRVAFLETVS